jgi:RimJ/RimL family protein N-acetyltransferase
MLPVTLRTPRLELSAPAESDVDEIFAACQDPDIQRYTTVPSPYRHEDAVGFIEKTVRWWAEGAEATWAMRHADGLAGVVGLHRLGASTGAAELGYWVTPRFRGRGLLTEASRAVVDWGFSPEGLGLARIEWRAVVGNVASARAARTLGFRYEGLLRAALRQSSGERDDGWIAGLLADDDRTPQEWPVL